MEDDSWYRPRPRRLCVTWDPTPPELKRHSPPTQFSAHVSRGQTAGWMKTSLGRLYTEVDLGPDHIVLDGDPPPPRERGTAAPLLSFRSMSIVATVAISATAELLSDYVYYDQTVGRFKMPLGRSSAQATLLDWVAVLP